MHSGGRQAREDGGMTMGKQLAASSSIGKYYLFYSWESRLQEVKNLHKVTELLRDIIIFKSRLWWDSANSNHYTILMPY